MMEKFFSRLAAMKGEQSTSSFARAAGISQQNMDRYLKGREPTLGAIITLCRNLGVSADWLLGLTNQRGGVAVSATNSTVAAFGGAVNGGDCSRCPLMMAAREAVTPTKVLRKAGK
ncbi:MAG: helix-turn-helix transcriptional regulator [Kiritimatiellae bacterium]|nr:helix-turn-helix transcriptional regulator [Kiritimatiellia bacterium]